MTLDDDDKRKAVAEAIEPLEVLIAPAHAQVVIEGLLARGYALFRPRDLIFPYALWFTVGALWGAGVMLVIHR